MTREETPRKMWMSIYLRWTKRDSDDAHSAEDWSDLAVALYEYAEDEEMTVDGRSEYIRAAGDAMLRAQAMRWCSAALGHDDARLDAQSVAHAGPEAATGPPTRSRR